jgi:hypothetical protein
VGFRKATKAQAKLRAAIFGPSGAGKTFSGLRIAKGMAGDGRIGVIDSERMTASKYSDRFDFDVLELDDTSVNGYIEAIKMAADEGFAVLVIDSLSHAWQQLLDEIDKLAKAKYRGNTWSAWSEGTPLQRKLIDAILRFPGHIIATMRSKTEWQSTSENGKSRPVRVGLAPEQGKGVEYEFDLLIEISTDHIANVIKDRTGKFQDKLIDKPGEDFGRELARWLDDGVPAQKPPLKSGDVEDAASIMTKASKAIAKAKTAQDIEKLATGIKRRLAEGALTQDQAGVLHDQLQLQVQLMDEATKQETVDAA